MTSFRLASVAAALALGLGCAHADSLQHPIVVGTSAAGVQVTSLDLAADALRIPQEVRAQLQARVKNLEQQTNNLLARRIVAQQALQQGLDKDPVVQAALQVARDRVLSDMMLERADAAARPSAEEVEGLARNIYVAQPQRFEVAEQVQARHILIAGKDAEARAKAHRLSKELAAGADFAALAKEHSADTGSAQRGGDLGFFGKGRMVPEFEQTAFALKDGQISDPVESQFGLHIIQRTASKPAGKQPFEEVREQLIKEVSDGLGRDARAALADKAKAQVQLQQQALETVAADYAKQIPAEQAAPGAK